MRKFFTLLSREIKAFFYSPVAYVVLFFFLILTGVNFFYFDVVLLNRMPREITVIEGFFNNILFWIGYLLIFPMITMRVFSEEFKMGTIEMLMTATVRDWQVVLSKFFACLIFYIILWLPSPLYFLAFEWISKSASANAPGGYFGSYLLMLLMGMYYISIGCFASVLTRNQIIAAAISFCFITVQLFAGLLSFVLLSMSPGMRELFGYFSAIEHMSQFSMGIIDSRPVVWYCSMTVFMLFLTLQVFQFRKWRA